MLNINKLLDKLEAWGCYPEVYDGCIEPGYDDGPIIAANWNHVPKSLQRAMDNAIDASDLECEWSDEWTLCGGCNKAVRTSPTSYGWMQSYVILNGETVCHKCVQDDVPEYLEHLGGGDNVADLFGMDFEEMGFERWNGRYENGWYPGQNDTPWEVTKKIQEKYPDAVVVFKVPSVGQFDLYFEAYYVKDAEAWENVLESA